MKLIYVSISFLIFIVIVTHLVQSNNLIHLGNYPWIFWIITAAALIYQRIQMKGQKARIKGLAALALISLSFISYYTESSFIGQQLLGYWLLFSSIVILSLQKLERNPFTLSVKRRVLIIQKNRCAICRNQLAQYGTDFHHRNGNNTNNTIRNCQALCTPCHRKKHASS